MVLNACHSATHTKDPFASVAVSLLQAGIRSVVAMSSSLWVSGAKVFIPSFYKQIFREGDIAKAMQAGLREMFRNMMRDTFIGQTEFHDWMVPVLYQQNTKRVLPKLKSCDLPKDTSSKLPNEVCNLGDYGLIGRDRAIQSLERAIRNKPAGTLSTLTTN